MVASGVGAVWWAVNHRAVPGHPSSASTGATGDDTGNDGDTRWAPTIVGPCSRVELATERTTATGNERCQRTPTLQEPQHWVEEPPEGFPTKSNAAGPFPGESCDADGDRDYSPVGDHVSCKGGAWQVIP